MPVYLFRKKYRSLDDYSLIQKISTGDESAFRELLSRYKDGIYSYAFQLTRIIETAEDVTQETFIKLYRISESMHEGVNVRAYIYKIARNSCIDISRKKKPEIHGENIDDVSTKTPYDELKLKEEELQLMSAISKLSENQKTAVLLRHTEGLSYKEISIVMALSVSAVESLLVRARKKLRTLV